MTKKLYDYEDILGVKQVGPHEYISNHPLTKPHPLARGVYGGNIVGQSVLVAIRSAPAGFVPNSIHSFFLKAILGDAPVVWKVAELANGKSFCHRNVQAFQDGDLKYTVNISLTRKNSHKAIEKQYNEYIAMVQKREQERQERRKKGELVEDDDDDDDDDEKVIPKPFHFQTPYPDWLKNADLDALPTDYKTKLRLMFHKVPVEFVDLERTKSEALVAAANRKISYFVRLGDDNVHLKDPAFQFVGLTVLLDLMFLSRLARVLRVPNVDMEALAHYVSVSLDHTVYIHDTDFDCTQWLGFSFRAVRFVNDRVLLEAEMYNARGDHVASVIQEGLVFFNGLEEDAKL